MNKNVLIAKQLIKLAKNLIADDNNISNEIPADSSVAIDNCNFLFCYKEACEKIGELIKDLQNNEQIKKCGYENIRFISPEQKRAMGLDAKTKYYSDIEEAKKDQQEYFYSYVYGLTGNKGSEELFIYVGATLVNDNFFEIKMNFSNGNKQTDVINKVIQKQIPYARWDQKKSAFDEAVTEFTKELDNFVKKSF